MIVLELTFSPEKVKIMAASRYSRLSCLFLFPLAFGSSEYLQKFISSCGWVLHT